MTRLIVCLVASSLLSVLSACDSDDNNYRVENNNGDDQTLCEDTGGEWDDGCTCEVNRLWDSSQGCIASSCLEECGDGCFLPEHMVCGEDGEFGCPCEMACRGIAEVASNVACCEPVAPGCVPSCERNTAMNCTSSTDGYDCAILVWTEEECGSGTCVAHPVQDVAYCEDPLDDETLCTHSGGTWSGTTSTCNCGSGGGWEPGSGCYGHDEQLCIATDGTWHEQDCGPYCGTCACPADTIWTPNLGCADASINECIEACGDGCFMPEHMICGEDGEFGCPCELTCRDIAEASSIMTCCDPVPSNCVPTCQNNTAMNCTSSTDDYGCPELVWTEEECGSMTCVVDQELAYCESSADDETLCTTTGGSWDHTTSTCDCGSGGGWEPGSGCYGRDQQLCIATGGTWHEQDCGPFCGTCVCATDTTWATDIGCVADTIITCVLECGDGCFMPEHKVCGEDGNFWCACDMACYGITEAGDISTCCMPVPRGCVSSCEEDVARNCTVGTDDYGCSVLEWTEVACAADTCSVNSGSGLATCGD